MLSFLLLIPLISHIILQWYDRIFTFVSVFVLNICAIKKHMIIIGRARENGKKTEKKTVKEQLCDRRC